MEYLLTDAQWARLAPLLPGREGTKGGRGQDNRRFVEAVLWLTRNGCRWRALPAAWGNWHTTYMRFMRWTRSGVWARVLAAVQQDEALHTLLVDSTTVRVHQHASGARNKTDRKPWGAAAAGQRHDAPRPCRCSRAWPRRISLPTAATMPTHSWLRWPPAARRQ